MHLLSDLKYLTFMSKDHIKFYIYLVEQHVLDLLHFQSSDILFIDVTIKCIGKAMIYDCNNFNISVPVAQR